MVNPLPLLLATALAIPVLSSPSLAKQPLPQSSAKTTRKAVSRSWVQLKAATDQTRYTTGQPIAVHLTATNTHRSGAYLRFTSGQRFDFSVYRSGTNEAVYTWSATRMFLQSTGFLWLKPGQSEKFETNIGDEMGQLKSGKYRLQARLTNSPRTIVAAPINFEVVDLGLAMTTTTDKTSYKVGESVKIDLAVANRKINLNSKTNDNNILFNSSQIFDVIVTDESETQIWNYGANLRFAQNQHFETWKKGETKNYSTVWNGEALRDQITKAKPGRYRVQGVLQSTPLLYAAPVFIDIVD